MLIYKMESSFLRRRAFALTCFNEATVLSSRTPSLDRFRKRSEEIGKLTVLSPRALLAAASGS